MTNHMPTLLRFTLSLIIIALTLSFLVYGRTLLIPLVVAIVIWYLIVTISTAIQAIPFFGKHLSSPFALFLAIVVCLIALALLFFHIRANITAIVISAPIYQERFEWIIQQIFKSLGIKHPPNISNTLSEFNFNQIAASLAQTATEIASSTTIILIYVIFLLMEQHSFDQKLQALIPEDTKLSKARHMIRQIAEQVQSYIKIKTFASVLTSVLSYVILRLVGVDFADFWALMIFMLNYIPTIGAIIATIFPCILTLVQFDSWIPFIIVAIGLISTQFYIGNILEPRLMGKSFNISALVIILSLAVWGHIWGIAGMFLCVPIMVIVNIILANFPDTQPIAILLSEKGEIKHD